MKTLEKFLLRSVFTFIFSLVGILMILALYSVSCAEHTSDTEWMRNYKGASGIDCCGTADCKKMPVSIKEKDKDFTTVIINGEEIKLPNASVHVSETNETWVCTVWQEKKPTVQSIRCAFYSTGM